MAVFHPLWESIGLKGRHNTCLLTCFVPTNNKTYSNIISKTTFRIKPFGWQVACQKFCHAILQRSNRGIPAILRRERLNCRQLSENSHVCLFFSKVQTLVFQGRKEPNIFLLKKAKRQSSPTLAFLSADKWVLSRGPRGLSKTFNHHLSLRPQCSKLLQGCQEQIRKQQQFARNLPICAHMGKN